MIKKVISLVVAFSLLLIVVTSCVSGNSTTITSTISDTGSIVSPETSKPEKSVPESETVSSSVDDITQMMGRLGKFAFISGDDIVIVNADGTNPYLLETGINYPGHPVWSPDGRKIAFDSSCVIYIVNADGTDLSKLTEGENPVWLPNGHEIAFVGDDPAGNNRKIYVVNTDGSNKHLFLPQDFPEIYGDQFAVSPEGNSIVLQIWDSDGPSVGWRLAIVKADASDVIYLTENEARNPAWSPDGRFIAYEDGYDLWIVESTGNNPRKIVDEASYAAWSPDSRFLAYHQKVDIYVMDIETGNKTAIFLGGVNLSWSPLQ